MTIHSDWVKILKRADGGAFTPRCPHTPYVAFIDGQIKLMCGGHIQAWSQFFKTQFVSTIDQAFALGAEVVVLGFDDYAFVPSAKNTTQQKRMRSVPEMSFTSQDELPPNFPDEWVNCIKNRAFKAKVINFVIQNVRRHYADERARTVVIDWQGCPEVVGKPLALPSLFGTDSPEGFEEARFLKRGECDIKAFSWLELGPTLLISTDGDYVPLALAQIEKQGITHPVMIHRMLCRVDGPGKRKADGKVRREFEFVDVQRLLAVVRAEFPTVATPARTFSTLVALTGCDFSMNLPAAGPTKVWASRYLTRKADITGLPGLTAFVLRVYNGIYSKHVRTITKDLQAQDISAEEGARLYEALSTSVKNSLSVAPRTKDAFWGKTRMLAHVKNTLWTLDYWTDVHAFPEPLSGDYGFEKKKNMVAFVGC